MPSQDPVDVLTGLLAESGRIATLDARRIGASPTYDARYRATVFGITLARCGKQGRSEFVMKEPLLRLYQFVAVHPSLVPPLLAWVAARDRGKLLPVDEEAGFPAGYASDQTHGRVLGYLIATRVLMRSGNDITFRHQPRTFLHEIIEAVIQSNRFVAERRALDALSTMNIPMSLLSL